MTSHTYPLHCRDLSVRYGNHAVLDQVTLDIPEGAVVGLVGRNGAGKSTLLRCLVGLALPSTGESYVLGSPSAALPDAVRARLGYVSQQPDLLPWLKVWAHVQYIGSFYPRWDEHRARRLCEQMNLDLRQRVDALSLGEQQKLCMVLALAHDPDVLVLDEPVASLDPLARREFMRLLFSTEGTVGPRDTPRTVLLSSHLLTDLERVVSHVVMLHEGHVALQGAWDALQESHGQTLEDLFVRLCGPMPRQPALA